MLEETKDMVRMMVEDDELFDLIAQLLKKSHAALIKAGFTEKQATAIVAGKGTSVNTN